MKNWKQWLLLVALVAFITGMSSCRTQQGCPTWSIDTEIID